MEVIDAPMPPFPDRDGGWYDFAPGETCLKRLPGRGFLKGYPYFTPEKGGVTREISLQVQQKSIRTWTAPVCADSTKKPLSRKY